MKRLAAVSIACSLAVVLNSTTRVGADAVTYDNFGPANAVSNFGDWMGSGFGEVMYVAQRFTPTVSGRITRLDALIWRPSPIPNEITFSVLPDVGQVPPRSNALWSQTFSGQLPILVSWPPPVTEFQVSNGPELVAGQEYWLYAETPQANASYIWQSGVLGLDPHCYYFASGPRAQTWYFYPQTLSAGNSLRVYVAIPEPQSLVWASALSALFRRRT